jgi:alpha-L-rhamnosidase
MYRIPLCLVRFAVLLTLLLHAQEIFALKNRSPIFVAGLKCEYLDEPLGIDIPRPRLSWIMKSTVRAQRQTAYQILVATRLDTLKADFGDVWDSGKIASTEAVHIEYDGKPLRSGTRYYWKLRVWDQGDRASAWSVATTFETGLLQANDWKAQWIEDGKPLPERDADYYKEDPAPLFRHDFTLAKPLRSARLYITGLGYYEAYMNGERVGDRYLEPGWTAYAKRVLYSTYDITAQVKSGENCIGVMLGNGWYAPAPMRLFGAFNLRNILTTGRPRLLAQIHLRYTDGTEETLGTGTDWQVGESPILHNNVYLGETYDARRETLGWNLPQGGKDWKRAVLSTKPIGELRAQLQPPITVIGAVRPRRISTLKPGVTIVDFGENFAGRVRLWAKGEAGTKITLRYGELLNADGSLNPMTSVACQIKGAPGDTRFGEGVPVPAIQEDTFILKGKGEETFSPRFTFHGFRYVEVTGYPGAFGGNAIEGQKMSAKVKSIGFFGSANPLLNRLQAVTQNTFRSNLFSVQSDCPHREKFGYGGDIVPTADSFLFWYDMAGFYTKVVHDFADSARPNGGLTETAPFVGIGDQGLGDGVGPIGWTLAHPTLLAKLYQYYGDRRLMEEQYEVAKRNLEVIRAKTPEHITEACIGDHETLDPNPNILVATAFYYEQARLVARFANLLKKMPDAEEYARLAESIKAAFVQRFVEPSTGKVHLGTQACQAFALALNLLPAGGTHSALQRLIREVRDTHNTHLSTGIFGTRFVMDTLTRTGHGELAYRVANQRTFPSWGFMLAEGETTLRETWKNSDNVYSHNHPMFGSFGAWLFEGVAGIRPADDAVGFNRFTLRPGVFGELRQAFANYTSIHGDIFLAWVRRNGILEVQVTVPIGTTATLYLPTRDSARIQESRQPVQKSVGVTPLGVEDNHAAFRLEAGAYKFRSPF